MKKDKSDQISSTGRKLTQSEPKKTLKLMESLLSQSLLKDSLKYIEHLAYLSSLVPMSKDFQYSFLSLCSSMIIIELSTLPPTSPEVQPFLLSMISFHRLLSRNLLGSKPLAVFTSHIKDSLKLLYYKKKQFIAVSLPNLSLQSKYKLKILSKVLQMSPEISLEHSLIALQDLIDFDLRSTLYPTFTRLSEPHLPETATNPSTLVLDLDETLGHMKNNEFLIRPGADEFIEKMSEHYEIVLFTASTAMYADSALQLLRSQDKIKLRLYREHMSCDSEGGFKDISKLGRDLNRVCIVDNLESNFRYHQSQGICIATWTGDPEDTELFKLSEKLVLPNFGRF